MKISKSSGGKARLEQPEQEYTKFVGEKSEWQSEFNGNSNVAWT